MASFESKFQRDLNRIIDNDRNTRKRGLQKLLDDLPWTQKMNGSEENDFHLFLSSQLFKSLQITISDSVEKCRELSLNILKKSLETCIKSLSYESLLELTQKLCARISEVPFPEPAEELRLLVSDLLIIVVSKVVQMLNTSQIQEANVLFNCIVQTLTKALTDNFPSVKRSCAELVCLVAQSAPTALGYSFKQILKSLLVNVNHQHSKTRVKTIQAIGLGLNSVSQEEYETNLKETLLNVFLRLTSDRTAAVKIQLSQVCRDIISYRLQLYKYCKSTITNYEFELVVFLFLLCGDDQEDVSKSANNNLVNTLQNWDIEISKSNRMMMETDDIDDGEVALRIKSCNNNNNENCNISSIEESIDVNKVFDFVRENITDLSQIILNGIEGWSSESKRRYLKGFNVFLSFTKSHFSALLPQYFTVLGQQVKDDEAEVREAADSCCYKIGREADPNDIIDILLPRAAGEVPGGDTSGQRSCAIRVLTSAIKGIPVALGNDLSASDDSHSVCYVVKIVELFADIHLYEFREAVMREAILLLIRSILETFPKDCLQSKQVQKNITLSLLFSSAKFSGEDDIVHEVSHRELSKYASAIFPNNNNSDNNNSISQLIKSHYDYLFQKIINIPIVNNDSNKLINPGWNAKSPPKGAFEVLLRECPLDSWIRHNNIIMIFKTQVQPPAQPTQGSAEANAMTYAAQRGEEVIPTNVTDHIDIRLSLLAILEGFIRNGISNWECGKYIAEAAEVIIRNILIPNLIWRIGRVEATIRKVALATCYSVLKAGALQSTTLFNAASELVPLIVSNLDDMETTPRQIASLCLTVLFERLRGAFSDQSVREIYPKLIARLDDSSDVVRLSICSTLEMFLKCSDKTYYRGTMIDYILDQLFIHLDDPDGDIQNAVYRVIIIASEIDKQLVLKKCESNKDSHRSPTCCNKLIVEIQGFEILED